MDVTIRLQQQPTQVSCVCTCIAMVLGIPAQVVIDKWNEKYHTTASLRDILEDYKIPFTSYYACDKHNVDKSGYYILGVPSLNYPGGMHQILAEYDSEEHEWCIFDPQKGSGYKYYDSILKQSEDGLAFPVRGYSIDAYINPAELP